MDGDVLRLEDGSYVLVVDPLELDLAEIDRDLPPPPGFEDLRDDGPLVHGTRDALQDLAVNGLLYGVAGNALWDGLKSLAERLRKRNAIGPCAPVDDVEIVRRVSARVGGLGHPTPTFNQVSDQGGQGWLVTGEAGGKQVTARLDPCGQVMVLRVD